MQRPRDKEKYEWEIMECETISREIIMLLLYEPFMLFSLCVILSSLLTSNAVCEYVYVRRKLQSLESFTCSTFFLLNSVLSFYSFRV